MKIALIAHDGKKADTVDFVYAMNEQTGQFAKCSSLAEVDEFLNAL